MSESTTVQIQLCLDRLAASDPNARAELVRLSAERLLALTRKLLGGFRRVRQNFDDTTGVFNEAYLKLHRSLEQVKPPTVREFMGLAALEIRRVLVDQIRKLVGRGAEPHPSEVPFSLFESDDDSHRSLDPASRADENSRLATVMDLLEAISRLKDEEQEAVHLIFFQGLTQAEAAEVMGVHKDTVKRYWASARVRLASKLTAFDPAVMD